MIWLLTAIPATAIFIAVVFFHIRTAKLLIPLALSSLVIFISEKCGEASKTLDTEYHTGYVTVAEYYEAWDEEVPCTHAKYRTQINSKGQMETVFDGFMHIYDVNYHPEHCQVVDNTSHETGISKLEFQRLTNKFGNKRFVDLHRNYHSIDGDKYITLFDDDDKKLESSTHTHFYENKVQSSNSIFNFKSISKQEKINYQLFDYPDVSGYTCHSILGYNDIIANHDLEILNGRLGKQHQIRVWITIYKNQPIEAAFAQEAYWKGGNKNELILAVGIDDKDIVQWGMVYSWTEVEAVKIECKDKIHDQEGKKIDLPLLIKEIKPIIMEKWQRKHFKDFKYIQIEIPLWSYIVATIFVFLLNILFFVFLTRGKI